MKKKNTLVSKLAKAALLLAAMAVPLTTAVAQSFNIFPVSQVWSYMATASDTTFCLDGTGWEAAGYDDSLWPTGPGGFTGGETTAATLTSLAGLLNTSTLPAPTPSSGRPQYFRTHFTLASTNGLSLIISNRIDDQAIFFINGSRVGDYRHPTTQTDNCAAAGAGGDEATVWVVITLTTDQLANIIHTGDNVLAVSVHQNATGSSDMVFCSILSGTTATPPPPPPPIVFTNGTGVITFDTLPPSQEWATVPGNGANTDIGDVTALDTAAKTNDAAIITSALTPATGNPPGLLGPGAYASDVGAQYIQTRPTGNAYTRIMATLTNLSGGTLNSVGIRYTLTVAAPIAEQVFGHLVYYSTSGTPGSWQPIPELTDAVNDNTAGSYPKSADITLSSSWNNNTKLYFLWVDDNTSTTGNDTALEIDNVQFVTLTPVAPAFANNTDPTNRTVVQCASVTLSAGAATGTPTPTYQWYKTSIANPIGGATSVSYTIPSVQPGDAGVYFVRASNGVGSPAESHHATLTVTPAPPFAVVSAVFTTNAQEIVVTMNRGVDPASVDANAFGFQLSGDLENHLNGGSVVNGTNIVLTTDTPRTANTYYCLTLDGNVASACDANVHPTTGPYPLTLEVYVVQIHDGGWQYNESGIDPGPNWIQTGYNDHQAGWQTGQGVFDQKGSTNRVSIGGVVVDTQMVMTNAVFPTANIPTYYFRKHFTFPVGATTLTLRPFFDDAAIIYINGFQVGQIGFTNAVAGPTVFAEYGTNYHSRNTGDASFDTSPYPHPGGYTNLPLDHVVVGDNVLAIELKQVNGTSSDITMGLELSAVIPGLGLNFTTDRSFQQTELTWCSGVLQYNTNLTRGSGWHDRPGATSPAIVYWGPGTGPGKANGTNLLFYRLRQ